MNGLIGRRVEVAVVELGSDIYLCSEFRINCAEAREKGLFFKTGMRECHFSYRTNGVLSVRASRSAGA